MALPDWTRSEDWEVLFLGGKRMPGVARVEVTIPSSLQKHKPRGAKKARVRDLGAQACELAIELELLPDEMAAFEVFVDALKPRAARAGRELEIAHPNTKLWGIFTVKIGQISSPQPGPGGSLVVRIAATEHVEDPKKAKAPSKSANSDPDAWNTDKLVDELRPSRSGAPQALFSSGVIPGVNFSEGDIPGSGF